MHRVHAMTEPLSKYFILFRKPCYLNLPLPPSVLYMSKQGYWPLMYYRWGNSLNVVFVFTELIKCQFFFSEMLLCFTIFTFLRSVSFKLTYSRSLTHACCSGLSVIDCKCNFPLTSTCLSQLPRIFLFLSWGILSFFSPDIICTPCFRHPIKVLRDSYRMTHISGENKQDFIHITLSL